MIAEARLANGLGAAACLCDLELLEIPNSLRDRSYIDLFLRLGFVEES